MGLVHWGAGSRRGSHYSHIRGYRLGAYRVADRFSFIAFASILTVTVDYDQGNLNLHYRSLFRLSTKVFQLSEVCLVEVVEDNERERMYRIELILQSGEVVPLRGFYSVGKRRKKRRAKRILTAIQVGSRIPAFGVELQPKSLKKT